jgi:hypothetical protein
MQHVVFVNGTKKYRSKKFLTKRDGKTEFLSIYIIVSKSLADNLLYIFLQFFH